MNAYATSRARPMLIALGLLVVGVITYCFAADPAADEKFKNGVPFATLQAEITANATKITELQTTTTTLSTSLTTLTESVAALTTRVTANESDIAAIETALPALQCQIEENCAQLQTQADNLACLQGDVEANAGAIAATEANIADLYATLDLLAAEMDDKLGQLGAQLNTLESELSDARVACDDQYGETKTQIQALQNEINTLLQFKATTLVEQATQNYQINLAQSQILTLYYRQNDLQWQLGNAFYQIDNHKHKYWAGLIWMHVHWWGNEYWFGYMDTDTDFIPW